MAKWTKIETVEAMLARVQDQDSDTAPTCPLCGQPNDLVDAEGYTDEAPRSYHADCWRIVDAARTRIVDAARAAKVQHDE